MDVSRFLLTCVLLLTFSVFIVNTSEPKCLNTSSGQGFCLYNGSLSWSKAREFCVQNGGILAIDKNQDNHLALLTLVRMETGMDHAWIGGKAVPLYWSWILPDGSAQKMYFQGCYEATRRTSVNENCVNVRNVEDCEKKCDVYGYYSLHKGPSVGLAMCCCGRSLGERYSEHCSKNGCLNGKHFCGTNQRARAWYALGTKSKMIKWAMWKPPGIKEHNQSFCGTVSPINNQKLVMEVHPCNQKKRSVCSGGPWRGRVCKSLEQSTKNQDLRRCLKVVYTESAWEKAKESCSSTKGMTGDRKQSLVTPSSADVYEALVNLLRYNPINVAYWISATNNAWRWYNDQERDTISEDIKSKHWKDKMSRVTRSGRCLAVNRDGKWRAVHCNIKVTHYICEYSPGRETTIWGQDESNTGDHKEGEKESQKVLTTPTGPKKVSLRSEVKVGLGIGGSILLVIVAAVICFIRRKNSSASSTGKSVQDAANTKTAHTDNGDSQNYEYTEDNDVTMYTSIPDTDKSYECVDRENKTTNTEFRVSKDMVEDIVYESVDKESEVYVSNGTDASNPEGSYSEVAVNGSTIRPDIVQSSSTQDYIYSMPNKPSGKGKGNVPEWDTIMIENDIYNT